jgi:hypothetical protein
VDKGYRGHRQNQSHFAPETRQDIRAPWRMFMACRKVRKPHLKAALKRRPAIKPVIDHRKSDHRMGRNQPTSRAKQPQKDISIDNSFLGKVHCELFLFLSAHAKRVRDNSNISCTHLVKYLFKKNAKNTNR